MTTLSNEKLNKITNFIIDKNKIKNKQILCCAMPDH